MPAEERKLATVLFADVVGSTAMAGDEDPERVRALLDRFYDAMEDEVERGGGTIEKFAGDAVMVAFGAPAAHEDDAERALHVALAMRERVGEKFRGRLALRIGVNTGEVVVGRPREGSSFVTGDTVNVCARLEQAAAPGEILVGERTIAAARGAFEFGGPTTIEAKGKPDGVACARLLRAIARVRPRGHAGAGAVFVGRQAELDRLEAAFVETASESTARLVALVGDAGVGKTRLTTELRRRLVEHSPAPLLRAGRCLSYGRGITYWPLGEVLREHFAIEDGDPAALVMEKLGGREALSWTLGLPPPADLHPLTVRDRLHSAWVDLLRELAGASPVVLLVEDIHWADDELVALLETLSNEVQGPLLLLSTARPELLDRRPGWAARTVQLGALEAADEARLIDALAGPECPRTLRDVIESRSEGNPFFVEEVVATLIDRGVIARNGGFAYDELPAGFSMPDTIQAVLAARVDLLPPREKAALQAAAVTGRTFWPEAVTALLDGEEPDLGLLVQREFVRPTSTDEYSIKHALTRDVAYQSVLKAKRAPLHARFAEWLEANRDPTEHAALLAHHYAESVRPEDLDLVWADREDEAERLRQKAVHWLGEAGSLAAARYEMDQALALYHRAVELERDNDTLIEIWRRIARVNALKFDGDAFWRANEKAIELGGPAGELYSDLAYQSVRRFGMWRQQPPASLINDWIDRALREVEDGSVPRARALYAHAAHNDDRAAVSELMHIADGLGDDTLRSVALSLLAEFLYQDGELAEARAASDELCAIAPRLPDPDDQTRPFLEIVLLRIKLGDLAAATQAATQMAQLSEGLTPHHRMHGAAAQLLVETMAGRWENVCRLSVSTETAVDANAMTPCPQNQTSLLHCALGRLYEGRSEETGRLEAKAEAIGFEGYRFWLDPPRMRLALARNDLGLLRRLTADGVPQNEIEPPATYFDALVAVGDRDRIEADAPRELRPGSYCEPFALRALGISRSDRSLIKQALDRFEALELAWHADQTRALL